MDLASGELQIHVHDLPGLLDPQDPLIQVLVLHRSPPPCRGKEARPSEVTRGWNALSFATRFPDERSE
jgi:hypothetical protein